MPPPSNLELRVAQKDKLFTLYKIKKVNDTSGTLVLGLADAIVTAEAVMEQEDVAVCKEKIVEYKG